MTSLFTKKSPLAVSFTLNVKTFPMPLKTCWVMALALFLSRQMLVIRISEQAYTSSVRKHSTCPSFCFTVFPEQAIPFHRNNVNYAISHVTQINGKSGHITELCPYLNSCLFKVFTQVHEFFEHWPTFPFLVICAG